MIQARTFGALLALGALTALPGCSYFGGGNGGSHYSQATPSTRYTAPAESSERSQASAQPTASNVQQPVTAAMIRRVQAQLKRDGLYHGHIDGLWGPKSHEAAENFQHRHGMAPTGKIDMPMLQAMNLTNGNEQFGETNGGPNGAMANQQPGQANTGPNGPAANQQYGEANTGAGNGPGANNGRIPPARNFTTGGQNSGDLHAGNMPNQNDNGAPNATGATDGTGTNGSNASNDYSGPANKGPAAPNTNAAPQH